MYLQNPNEQNLLLTSVDYVFNWARKSSRVAVDLRVGLLCN